MTRLTRSTNQHGKAKVPGRTPPAASAAREENGGRPRQAGQRGLGAYWSTSTRRPARPCRSADRPRARRSSAPSRCCAAHQEQPALCRRARTRKTRSPRAWARKIIEGEVPEVLKDRDLRPGHGALLAGSAIAATSRNGGRPGCRTKRSQSVLFIDEIHTLIGAAHLGGRGCSNLLSPRCSRVSCAASARPPTRNTATTREDRALVRPSEDRRAEPSSADASRS